MTKHGEILIGAGSVGIPFGRYLIKRRLGRGGMGEVFLADQLGPLGPVRPVALKRLLPQLASDEPTLRMFLEEMGTAAQLNHPGIATTYDFGEVEGVYFLAMEYVEGLALNRVLSEVGPLPLSGAVYIAKAVAESLEHAHSRSPPVVHQDVSPHNIMLSVGGSLKLLDFGIARAEAAMLQASAQRAQSGIGEYPDLSKSSDISDRVHGKVAYAPPEQLRGRAPDRRFDLWALGVVLYELITGARPFADDDPAATIAAAENRDYQRVEDRRPEAAPIADLVWRALEPDPDRRWLAASAFVSACTRAAQSLPPFNAGDLAALVEQAGGPDTAQPSGEITATGVAAVDVSALGSDEEPTIEEEQPDRAKTPPPSRWRLALMAILAGLAAGVMVFLMAGPEKTETPVKLVKPVKKVAVEPPEPPPIQKNGPPENETKVKVKKEKPIKKRAKTRRTKRKSKPTAPKPVVEEKKVSGLGVLSVRTTPWASVRLDGRSLGEGIIAEKPVRSGSHTLRLIAGEGSFEPIVVPIQIEAGKSTKVFVDFETGRVQIR